MVCSRCCFTTACTAASWEALPMGERNQAGNRSAGAMLRYLLGRLMK
jgi:hypothetical protein